MVTVCQGKYHQVRRMLAARGMPVSYLERRAEGGSPWRFAPGQVRLLTQEERRLLTGDG